MYQCKNTPLELIFAKLVSWQGEMSRNSNEKKATVDFASFANAGHNVFHPNSANKFITYISSEPNRLNWSEKRVNW